MLADILPGRARGIAAAPPSKSMAHRHLICGALSGESTVRGLSPSEDILATAACIRALGGRLSFDGDTAVTGGLDPSRAAAAHLPCRESGSTLRFFLPFCLLSGERFTLGGAPRLLERPMTIYETLCRERGLFFAQTPERITVQGTLRGGDFSVDGGISSQFITGLLFVLPLLKADSRLRITGSLQSASYLLLTLSALRKSGITVVSEDLTELVIPGNQTYQSADLTVEGDWSNAAFLDALAFLGGDVTVTGLCPNSLQGDRVYRDLLPKLETPGAVISLADCPDLGPILFALAAAKQGAVFTDTRRLRIKESDRAAVMAEELRKFGVSLTVEEDRVIVPGGPLQPPAETLCSHNDHRIVMALAVLCTLTGGRIDGAEAVKKSMPDFWDKLKSLNIQVNIR